MIYFFFTKVFFVWLDGDESLCKQFSVLANTIQCLTLSLLPTPFPDLGVSVDSDESQCEPLIYYSYNISDNPLP